MARPQKNGLEYFPLDVDIDDDSAVALIEAKHGLIGFAVFVKLLARIYREGYFVKWDEREAMVFSRRSGADADTVRAVVSDCVAEGLFDSRLFDNAGVLTSAGIQSRYIQGTGRRRSVRIRSDLLLVHREAADARHVELVSDGVNVDINPAQAELTSTVDTQSKVKERRVKESTLSDAERLACLLVAKVKENDPRSRAGLTKETPAILDLLASGRTAEEVESAIRYIFDDEAGAFWRGVVVSGATLDRQFEKIVAQIKTRKGNQSEHGVTRDDLSRYDGLGQTGG